MRRPHGIQETSQSERRGYACVALYTGIQMMFVANRLVLVLLLLGVNALAPAQELQFQPLTQDMLNNPDPNDWLMWRGNYENWGYSPLDQINAENVTELRLAWSFAMAPGGTGMQVEPTVYDGVLYLRHPNENYSAHDAATGDVIWEYSRPLTRDFLDNDPGLSRNRGRGVFIYQDKLLTTSTDGFLIALDPATGAVVWEAAIGNYRIGDQPSGAPVVFNGVIAVPWNCTAWTSTSTCHMSGFSVENGELLWRWYTSPTPEDPMHRTWGDDPQVYPLEERRNMSPWATPAVDTERGLFIFGVGSSAPQQPELAGTDGEWPDRLYQGSTVALDHRTGQLIWWAQHHTDMWNNDAVYDHILVDSPMRPSPPDALGVNPSIQPGESRQLVIGSFSKDAIFYAYDRGNGQFMYARPTAYQNLIAGYDGITGAYRLNPEVVMSADQDHTATVCKENRQVPQGAYSPLTNAYYLPAFNGRCTTIRLTSLTPTLETGYNTTTIASIPSPVPHLGQPEAINVETGETLWRLDIEAPMYGMLTTGGGLLFTADTRRRFYAIDQHSGEILWQTILNGLSDMAPISFGVDGRQYIAVISPGGTVGSSAHIGQLGIPGVPTGYEGTGHTLFVFALPE